MYKLKEIENQYVIVYIGDGGETPILRGYKYITNDKEFMKAVVYAMNSELYVKPKI